MGKTIQLRDVDDRTYTALRTRAAAEHLSLTAYVKRELDKLTSGPTMAELLDRADQRRRRGIGVSSADILAAVHELRDEDSE